eukprot:TRINITY_DN61521_c0_g1_i1.p1 TRINITY_DN61521_c0_g1~~TRINITY_DN61521_c0_g1_i1.p1  ORF type:complete len:227 (+),score=63.41 TRINITY_DN61521_c0_g1_i1:87-767(+)
MPKKKKKTLKEEGPPDASIAEINQVLLGDTKKGAPRSVIKSATKPGAAKTAGAAKIAKPATAAKPELPKGFDGAKIALELIEGATSQLLRRKGWFRDVRLRRSADAFMKSSKLHQKASARQWADDWGKGFEKPSQEQLNAYEKDLQAHLESLRGKLGSAPMNERREICIKSAGPGKVIGEKLKGLKERAAELERKPRSVRKGTLLQKKRLPKGTTKKAQNDVDDDA